MHIACTKNHGISYLQVHEAYPVIVNGKSKQKIRVVKNIGPLSRYDDGKPDYLFRLRQSFKAGNPLIPELSELVSEVPEESVLTISLDKNNPADCFSNPKNIGYFLLDSLYDKLGIYDVLNLHKSRSKIKYDLNGLAKLLVFGRVLNPDSKSATWQERDAYLFDVASSEIPIEIFRALDVLDAKAETIQRRMNLKVKNSIGRDTDICFYDVTNYWFEIDDNYEDLLDNNGNIVKEGIRKRGPSKAKNRKPIVQMGLFMDSNGIPIAYKLFPGNHIDQTTLRPALEKTIDKMAFGRVIIVADGGLNSGKNLARIISAGNGYIVSKSAKGSAKKAKEWIADQNGYISNKEGTFKLKSKIHEREVEDENGEKVVIREKVVSYWSQAQYAHALHENKNFIDYLNAVIEFPDKLKDKQSKLQKYLTKKQVDKETGEIINTVSILALDMDKIQMDLDLMGYYTVMTSEVDMPDRDVINKYHGLSRIEESFRTIKSDLEGRPIHVKTDEHINAHFLICFIALTMIKIIQYKILVHLGIETKNVQNWELGLSADRIKKALAGFEADALSGGLFRLTKPTDDLKLILDAFNVKADLRLPTVSQLHQLKYVFDNAAVMLV
jgi:transposase